MLEWYRTNLTALGKAIVITLVCAGVVVAVIVAYSLMGP